MTENQQQQQKTHQKIRRGNLNDKKNFQTKKNCQENNLNHDNNM